MKKKASVTTGLTQTELAKELGVSRMTLHRWQKDPDAPKTSDVEQWKAYAETHAREGGDELKRLRGELLKEQIAAARLKRLEAEGQSMPVEEAVGAARRATAMWQMALKAKLETEAPARLLGKDIAEIRHELAIINDELNDELQRLFKAEAKAKPQ